jgi:hypothetical protein
MATPRVIVIHEWYLDVPADQVDEDFDLIANTGVSMMENHMRALNPKMQGLVSRWHLMWIDERSNMDKERQGDMFPTDPTASEVTDEIRKQREAFERATERQRRVDWDREHGPLSPQDQQEQGHGLGEIEAVSEEDIEVDE